MDNLDKRDLINKIEGEMWKYHHVTADFLKHHSTEPDSELVVAINALCMKSHNEVLGDLIKYIEKYEQAL